MKECLNCKKDITHKRKSCKFCSLKCSTQHTRLQILHKDIPDNFKRCGKCQDIKRYSEFRKNKNGAFGLNYYCKQCDKSRIYYRDRRKILLNAAKKRAKEKNLDFNLSLNDIVLPEFCPILGIKLEFNESIVKDNSYSIDRIDPNKGYIIGNIQIVSFKANTLKNNATIEELEKVISYLKTGEICKQY